MTTGYWQSLTGGLRSGSGANPAPTLDELMEQVSRLVKVYEDERVTRRHQLQQLIEESISSASATQVVLHNSVQGLFRVCFLLAYSDSAATLQLKGDNNSVGLQIQVPAKTWVTSQIGDRSSGGIFLAPADTRQLTMNGSSPVAGNMTLILTGVEIPTQMRW